MMLELSGKTLLVSLFCRLWLQAVYSDGQEQARRRRNRNISLMLTGMDTSAIHFWQVFVSIIILKYYFSIG